jgi:hydroxymethylpyrimidine/phosphomethylpyrimidine kinase
LLLGQELQRVDQLVPAAQGLLALGARAVLLKGGHLTGSDVVDVLLSSGQDAENFASRRIASHNVHGTGCTLSSAIAVGLAQGLPLREAVVQARRFILQAIEQGASVRTGQGHGPLNHGHHPIATMLLPV